jgi:hypothetical protein
VVSLPLRRPIATLFDAGSGFYCRKCLRLGYACQQVTKRWRPVDRAQSLRMPLGGSAKIRTAVRAGACVQAEGLARLDQRLTRRARPCRGPRLIELVSHLSKSPLRTGRNASSKSEQKRGDEKYSRARICPAIPKCFARLRSFTSERRLVASSSRPSSPTG